jgi:hypothetical protein
MTEGVVGEGELRGEVRSGNRGLSRFKEDHICSVKV